MNTGPSTKVLLNMPSSTILAGADVVANYTFSVIVLGGTAGSVSLSATAPSGIQAVITPSSVNPFLGSNSAQLSLKVSASVPIGKYSVNFTSSAGAGNSSQTIVVQVVKNLVVTVGKAYIPSQLDVKKGDAVYWVRLNGAIDQYDDGSHDVNFNNGMAKSGTLQQWGIFSYQFNATGTFTYYCSFHPSMQGTITVA